MCIKSELKEICLKLATNGRSDKGFLLTSKVCPKRVFCPCPWAIYMYKIIRNVYKIRFWRDHLKLALYGQREKALLLSSKFCPQGVACPCPGAIYMYKSIKIYTRTRCQVSVYRTTGPLVHHGSIKLHNIEDIWYLLWKIQFYFSEWTPKSDFSRVAVAKSENTSFGVHEWNQIFCFFYAIIYNN